MKKYFEELIARKKTSKQKLMERLDSSEDVNEVRSMGVTLNEIEEEIRNAQEQLDALIEAEENAGAGAPIIQERFNPLATYGLSHNGEQRTDNDPTNSDEYRSAFMNMVTSDIPIPTELRANESSTTGDVGSVIPTVLVNKIIERMEHAGMILPLVTKTSYKAGISIPTSSVKPVATWVGEGKTSDKQKKKTGKISFTYHKLRCEISMSMEVGTMALSAFEAKFVDNVSKAMVIAKEKAILNGDGTTQPKGILKETPAATVTISADVPTYKELLEIEGKVPADYESSAVWFMTKPQFMKFLSMVDDNKQPIARVNYGVSGKPERILLGREVVIHSYADEMGDVVAGIFDFSDYVFNTIYDMGIQKKQDWDTEDLLTKAVTSADGKVIDTSSLIFVKATAAK